MPTQALAVHAERMVAEVPLIDLDRPSPTAEETGAAARSRPARLLAVLVTALLALGGSVVPPPGLTPVLSVSEPVTAVQLGAGSLFLSTPALVRRYDLPTGDTRWTRTFDEAVQTLWTGDADRIVLVLSGAEQQRLTALDADSGRQLWFAVSADTAVLAVSQGGVLTQSGVNGRSTLRLTDVRTGRTVWSRDVDPAGFLGPDALYEGGSPWIVAVGNAGDVVVLSYADGSVLSRGDLGLIYEQAGDRSVPANSTSVSVVGDRLYLSRRVRGRASLTAYSVRPLTALWRTEGGPVGIVSDCGAVLCVADTRWVTAVDPAGGGVRWEQPSWGIAYQYDAGRLFAYDNKEDAEAALIDAGTGRVLHPLGHSRQLGRLILRTEGIRTWVSVPDPATGDLRTAGSMTHVASFRCQEDGDYLVCATLTGDTTVWRVG
ncbi:PQQ-binding-like beta-propeller repeat protein [Actinoplanes sp. NPDC051513]|uniref:outer membrane protein assembly factor BamB family protein n=1 Tax=Actinoplanes sp. NPDC051513 TaxID=3363908 RepID=UPI0037AB45D6